MAAAKVLITGAGGQLGLSFGSLSEVTANRDRFFRFSKGEMDLAHWDSCLYALRSIRPDIIINCAAYTNVAGAETDRDSAFALNRDAPGHLAEYCSESGCRLVHFSTDYVFDGMSESPYTEDSPVNPLNVYGLSKAAGERAIMDSGCDYWIIRTSWLFSSFGENFVTKMIRMARERGEIRVVNDQIGSPTYAPDLADAVLRALQTETAREVKKGLFHLANSGRASWFDLAKKAVESAGIEARVIPVTSDAFPLLVLRPAHSVLSSQTFETTFGIALRPWEEAVAACVNEIEQKQKTS